jgi:serine/threonine-protein kinase
MMPPDHDTPSPVQSHQGPPATLQDLCRRWRRSQSAGGLSSGRSDTEVQTEEALAALRYDQCQRWRAGERVPAEWYLETYSVLRSDSELEMIFIYGEFLLRRELGEAAALDEFLQRFPQHAERLRQQDELHRVLEEVDESAPATWVEGRKPASGVRPEVPSYEVLEEIGKGGMGVVYKARQKGLDRVVALKMVRGGAGADPEELVRFRREAEAVARLVHPNIIQIYEIGEWQAPGTSDPVPYFSMEYVDGGSLVQQLAGTPLSVAEAARLVETLARAMHYAHQRGVVHLDLKPGNILLAACGLAGESAKPQAAKVVPKITDFGLAKRIDGAAAATQSGSIVGTPSYMAPEQAEGNSALIGPPADVYALGAILYELLTGRPPFKADTPLKTVAQVVSQEPVPPRRRRPETPRDLETICLKCLHKDARRRYGSAEELADDLRRYQDGEPIRARPVGRAERFWLWCRRSPVRAGLAAALLLAVLAGGLLAVNLLREQQRVRELDEHRARLLREIDASRAALLEKLDEERRRREQQYSDEFWEPDEETEAATPGPEVQAEANRLKGLLGQLKAEPGAAPEDTDLPLRLAEATVANAEQRFDQTLAIVTGDDLAAERGRTDGQIEREVEINRVRGDAFYGMKKWKEALECYRRILQLQPGSWADRRRVVDCLNQLRRTDDALAEQGKVIDELTRLVEKESRADLASALAASLSQRGSTLFRQGKVREAAADLDKAVAIRTRLVEKEGRKGLEADLATSLTERGMVLRSLGKPADAFADLDKAVAIRTQLVEKEGKSDLAGDLATSLTNRGAALTTLGKAKDALEDLDKAIAIRTQLVEQGRKGTANDLANSLDYRGIAWRAQGKLAEAFADHDQAVQIRTRMVEKEGRKDLANRLAGSLSSRGGVLRDQGKVPEALADYEKSVAILTQLVEGEGRKDVIPALTNSLAGRGFTLRDQGKLAAALADFDKAVALRTQLVEKDGRKELTLDVARALDGRGTMHLERGNLAEAVADYEKAVAIFTRMIEQEGRKELTNALAGSKVRLDRAKLAVRAVEDVDVALKQPPQLAAELLQIRTRVLASRGRHADAATTGDKFQSLGPEAPYFLYWAARSYSLSVPAVAVSKKDLTADDRALQARYAEKAMDLLRQAIDRGYKDVKRLRYEPDLDPLRSRDDFKKLLAEVEEKAREDFP